MRKNVLVIDDDNDTLDMMVHLFKHKLSILTAHNSTESLALLKQSSVNLVICDVHLDDENGFEVIESFQKDGMTIPVIILTGHVDEATEARAQKLGVFSVIEKPFEIEHLLQTIEKGLSLTEDLQNQEAHIPPSKAS